MPDVYICPRTGQAAPPHERVSRRTPRPPRDLLDKDRSGRARKRKRKSASELDWQPVPFADGQP